MRYHLCFKENDSNLLHIVSDKDLKSSKYRALKSFKKAKDEEDAFEKVASLAKDFCKHSKKQGKSPDFSQFKTWLLEVYG